MDRPQFSPQQRSFLVREYHRTNSVDAVLERLSWGLPPWTMPLKSYRVQKCNQVCRNGNKPEQNPGKFRQRENGQVSCKYPSSPERPAESSSRRSLLPTLWTGTLFFNAQQDHTPRSAVSSISDDQASAAASRWSRATLGILSVKGELNTSYDSIIKVSCRFWTHSVREHSVRKSIFTRSTKVAHAQSCMKYS